MLKERSYKGYWWLPGNDDDKVGGELKFSQDNGVELDLLSSFEDYSKENVQFETIFGISTTADPITVKDTIRTRKSKNTSFNGKYTITSSTYTADHVFVGKLFEKDPKFDSLKFEFPLLFEWMNKSGVTTDMSSDSEGLGTLEHELPNSYSAQLEEFQIEIHSQAHRKNENNVESIQEDAYFLVNSGESENTEFSFKEARKFAHQLQSFVTFAMSEEIHPKKVIGQIELPDMPPIRDINILYPTGGDPNNPQSIDPNTENFLLTDVENRFSDVMEKWFNRYDELRPVFSLYFSTKYNSNMYVENEFLNLTTAIESYHRMGDEGIYLEPDNFDDYYEHLVEDIPENFDQSFKDHLKDGTFEYANEYSLRKRLKVLKDEHRDLLDILPADFAEKIDGIVNARNDLTHRETGKKPDAENLIQYSIILQALLDIILLKEIGISKRQIMENIDIRYRDRLKNQ